MSSAETSGCRVPCRTARSQSPLIVETTAVFLPAEPNFLMSATMRLLVGVAERRVVDHDVLVLDALATCRNARRILLVVRGYT